MKKFEVNGKSKKTIIIAIISVILILCTIIGYAVKNVTKLVSLENNNELANLSTSIKEINGAGNNVGEIIIGGTYRNGFCVMYEGSLYGGVSQATNIGSAYDIKSNGQIRWLLDNMYLPYGEQSSDLKELSKENIKNKIGIDISKLSSNDIYAVEQYVLWQYTDKRFGTPGPSSYITGDNNRYNFYKALKDAADSNANYKSNGQSKASVSTTNAKVKVDGTNMIIGPFTIKENNTISTLNVTAKLNDSKVSAKMYTNKGCTNELGKYITNKEQEIYVKISNINKNINNNVSVEFSGKTYSTDAKYWSTDYGEVPQPVVTLERSPKDIKAEFSGEYKVPAAYYDLYIQKIDQATKEAIKGVKFKIEKDSQVINTTPTNTNGYVVVKNQKITAADISKDTYIITEVEVAGSYFKLKKPISIYVKKDTTNLKVKSVSFSSNIDKETTEVELEDSSYKVKLELSMSDDGKKVYLKIPNLEKNFDLALRKIIKSVKRKGVVVYDGDKDQRYPDITITSAAQLMRHGTIQYNNKKDPVKVQVGDTIVYTLRVYNEGSLKGYVKEITDYLPEGLKLASNSTINTKYNWKQDGNKAICTMSDFDIDPANNGLEIAKECAGVADYNDYYEDVEIECEVTNSFKGVLTNVSEITQYGKYEGGEQIDADQKGIDRDSIQNNVFTGKVKNNKQYFDQYIVDDSITKYYEGIEDDDDFENIEIEGQYDIEIEKVDAKDESKKLKDVEFSIESIIRDNTDNAVIPISNTYKTNEEGKINLPTQAINSTNTNCKDEYNIEEISLGSNSYVKLKYPITLKVTKTITNDGEYKLSKFELDGNDLTQAAINRDDPKNIRKYLAYDEAGNRVNINVNLDEQNNKLYIKIDNNPLEDISLNVKKVDMDDENKILENAEFKVTGPDGNNIPMEKGKLDFTIEKAELNKEYQFSIEETKAEDLYYNLFEGLKIILDIKTNVQGKIDSANLIIQGNDENKINEALKALSASVNEARNNIDLIIKNPQMKQSFKINLNKHNLDSEEGIDNAVFEVYKSNENKEEIEKIGNDITTKKGENQEIVKVENSTVDTTYYYLIKEKQTPANYNCKYSQVLVKVNINKNAEVTSSIEAMYDTQAQQWQNYQQSKYLSIAQNGEDITIGIANNLSYEFGLYKKDFAGENDISTAKDFTGTANFEIKQIYPESQVMHNGALVNAKKEFSNTEAKANGVYKYEITETDVSSGYYKTLIGKTIEVTVRTDANGNVLPVEYGGTEYKFKDEANLTNEEKLQLASLIKLEVGENNKINFYVANIPEGTYRLQLVKVDSAGTPIKEETEFNVQLPVALENGETSWTSTTSNSILTTPNQPIEEGKVHNYVITETKAPSGYKKLEKEINLSVDLTNASAFSQITSQMITCKYGDGSETLEGLQVYIASGANGIPIIQVYIPNHADQHVFELRKEDLDGNLITCTEDANYQIDGTKFIVSLQPYKTGESNVPEGTDLQSKTILNGYLKDGIIDENVVSYKNMQYTYDITEVKAKNGYINILGDNILRVIVKTGEDAKISNVYYEIHDPRNHFNNITETFKQKYGQFIEVSKDANAEKVIVKVKNTTGYKVRLNKEGTDGKPVTTATITARYNSVEECILNKTQVGESSHISENAFPIGVGQVQKWRIDEHYVKPPYKNVFKNKYIEVDVTMDESKTIKVLGYTIKDSQTDLEVTQEKKAQLSKYIKGIEVVKENGISIVDVKLVNPLEYKFELEKAEYDDNQTQLSGAVLKVNDNVVISNGSSKYEETVEDVQVGKVKNIVIEEDSTTPNHINILENKKLIVGVMIDQDYNLVVKDTLIEDKQTGNTSLAKTSPIYKYLKIETNVKEDGSEVVTVKILNPSMYNFELLKTDAEGNVLPNTTFKIVSPIVKEQNGEYINEVQKEGLYRIYGQDGLLLGLTTQQGKISFQEKYVAQNKTYEYEISEIQAASVDYINMLKDYSLYVKVNVGLQGTISLQKYENGKDYILKNANGEEASEEYYKYVNVNIEDNTVKVKVQNPKQEPKKYNFVLNKVDEEGQPLSGAKFTLTLDNKQKEQTLLLNEAVEGTFSKIKQDAKINETYIYKVIENESAQGYINALNNNYILIPVQLNGEAKIAKGNINTGSTENDKYYNKYGFIIMNSENEIVLEDATDLYSKIKLNINNESEVPKVQITIPNEKETEPGKYSLELEKVDEKSNKLSGVTFKVNGNETQATGQDGKVKIVDSKEITKDTVGTIDEYKVSEVKAADEYITLDEEITVYVSKKEENKKYVLNKASFSNTEEVTTKEVTLKDGSKATAKIAINAETVTVTIPNKLEEEKTGKYSLEIEKIDTENNKVSAVTFKVNDTQTQATGENGKVTVIENTAISKSTVGTIDEYKISEIKAADKYVTLNEDITIYVSKKENDKEYTLDKVSFSKDKEETTKEVTLKDGTKVNVTIKVENNVITVTIPNKKVEIKPGKYSLEIEKVDTQNAKLAGVTFKVNENETQATGENGKVTVVTDKEITEDTVKTVDTYKISEVKVEDKYAALDQEITVYVRKKQEDKSYTLDKVSFSKDKEVTQKEVVLKDGSKVNVTIKVENNVITVTVPNKPKEFDLALRKWVTKAIVIEDGKQTITQTGHKAEDDPEDIVKVEINRKKLNSTVVKFEYQIRVTNEGEIEGYAKEISDYIPEGLKFNQEDNPTWKEVSGKVTTDQLKDTLLQPGQSAEVTIVLTWINGEDNMGLKVNTAEISEDYNKYGKPDKDSTPNNKVPGEDDIDDAPVMLTISTGKVVTYFAISLSVLTILVVGVASIKKFVL